MVRIRTRSHSGLNPRSAVSPLILSGELITLASSADPHKNPSPPAWLHYCPLALAKTMQIVHGLASGSLMALVRAMTQLAASAHHPPP